MQQADKYSEELISTLTSEYLEKMFYFCLKKTGDPIEAEELASDVMVNVIEGLRKGTIPSHFPAWVWRIARNRYSVWAEKKRRFATFLSRSNIGGLECHHDLSNSDSRSVEAEYLHSEDLMLLRRELAFVSKDYRDIVVAFYVEDRKIKDIACTLRLPEGTVKTKLFRARKKLKEGMSMARQFGVRSYKPENVNFVASGSQPSGLPWKAVGRQIPKNVLLQANNNPSTIEELSVELGIAVPYMEEEVGLLTEATLLRQVDDSKFITNLFIADKDCQMVIYQALRSSSLARSKTLELILEDSLPHIKRLDTMRNTMCDTDFKWFLVIYLIDQIIKSVKGFNLTCPVRRNDGGNWGFIGLECADIPENIKMGHNGCGSGKIAMFWAYKISDYNLWNRVGEMSYSQVLLLCDLVKNRRNVNTLTDSERENWLGISGRFAHSDEEGRVVPDIAVLEKDTPKALYNIIEQHRLYNELLHMYQKTFDDIVNILKSNSNPVLYEQLNYCASMFILDSRMMTVHDFVQLQKLVVPSNPEKSPIAMYMEMA